MTAPDDPTRRLLAPRRRSRPGADTPARKAGRRAGWRVGAALVLLAAAAAMGRWLWPPSTAPAPPLARPLAAVEEPATPRGPAAAVPSPAAQAVAGVAPAQAKAPPPVASLSELLQRPASTRLRWSRFSANPAIVVIEYPNLHEQGLAMNRLAAMFEKRMGRRDRVPTEKELGELMRRSGDTIASFYQGHDYPAAKVARFFSMADAQRVTLNARELELRSVLLEAELIRTIDTGAFQAAGEQAAVSFTGVQPDDPATAPDERVDGMRREAVLRHELSHGEFFTNAAYRAHCMKFWRHVLSAGERKVFSAYLKGLDYDPSDEELMANETQALLMHTPDSRAFSAGSLGISDSALADLRIRFRAGEPAHGLRR